MTADDVAALLKMPRSTVDDYARRGLLPSIKLGRHRRFVRDDVIAALEDLRGLARSASSDARRRRARRPR